MARRPCFFLTGVARDGFLVPAHPEDSPYPNSPNGSKSRSGPRIFVY